MSATPRHRRLLLIEDNQPFRELVATMLTHAGYAVVEAADGAEGLTRLVSATPDLVLTDIVMANKDGIETIIELRKRFPVLPIIAMAGNSNHTSVYLKTARLLGANRILEKPFSSATLLHVIAEVLGDGAVQPNRAT